MRHRHCLLGAVITTLVIFDIPGVQDQLLSHHVILDLAQEVCQLIADHVLIIEVLFVIFRVAIEKGLDPLLPRFLLLLGSRFSCQLLLSNPL